MLRVSEFLKLVRLSLEQHAASGQPLPPDMVPSICDMLRMLGAEAARMERQLAGRPVQIAEGGNVVSLAAWAASRGIVTLPSVDGGPA